MPGKFKELKRKLHKELGSEFKIYLYIQYYNPADKVGHIINIHSLFYMYYINMIIF